MGTNLCVLFCFVKLWIILLLISINICGKDYIAGFERAVSAPLIRTFLLLALLALSFLTLFHRLVIHCGQVIIIGTRPGVIIVDEVCLIEHRKVVDWGAWVVLSPHTIVGVPSLNDANQSEETLVYV